MEPGRGTKVLGEILPLMSEIKGLVDANVDRLMQLFVSPEWRVAMSDVDEPGNISDSNTFGSIFRATAERGAELQASYVRDQALSNDLQNLDIALRGFLPVHKVAEETFLQGDAVDRIVRDTCESIDRYLETSFGSREES